MAQARRSSILDKKLIGKQLCQEGGQITENNRPGVQAWKSCILNNKLIENQCQEDEQIPGNNTAPPGPDVADS